MTPQDWLDGLMRLAHRDVGFPALQTAAHKLIEQMDADGLILWTPDGQALAPTAGPMGADKEDMLIYLSRFEYREPDAPKEGATVHPSLIPPKNPNLN